MSFFSKGYLHPPNQSTCTAGLNRMAKASAEICRSLANLRLELIPLSSLQRWGFGVSGLTVLSHSNGSVRALSFFSANEVSKTDLISRPDRTRMAGEGLSRSRCALMLRGSRLLLSLGGKCCSACTDRCADIHLLFYNSPGSAITCDGPCVPCSSSFAN